MIRKKTILLISPEPWDHVFVSKHHYAIHLARRGNQVFFLNPPQKGHSLKVTPAEYENLNVINYDGFLPGLRFLPAWVQRFFVRRKFHQIERLTGSEIAIIWSFDNSVFYDFYALPHRVVSISHIVDLNQNFETEKAAITADICFGATQALVSRTTKFNKNSFFINHGFAPVERRSHSEVQLPGENGVKAVYIGNLAMKYLDWQILLEAVDKHRNVDFIFLGPNEDEFGTDINPTHIYKKEICKAPNAYFCGRIHSHHIMGALQQADMALIAYMDRYHKDQSNPHKMIEYLASGKPIVATYTAEYADKKDLLYMSGSNSEWLSVFSYVVANLQECSEMEVSARRKKFAVDNTYDKQIERIERLLNTAIAKD